MVAEPTMTFLVKGAVSTVSPRRADVCRPPGGSRSDREVEHSRSNPDSRLIGQALRVRDAEGNLDEIGIDQIGGHE